MSFSFLGRKQWRTGSAQALIFTALAGAVTAIVGCAVALRQYVAFPDLSGTYRINVALTLLIDMAVALIPVVVACALGVVMFGFPVSRWLGYRLVARWFALLGFAWGGVAGGMLGVVLLSWILAWDAGPAVCFLSGAIFGAPTGFWWWFFYRRVLIRRAALAD